MDLMSRDSAVILYESPHRLVKLLKDIAEIDDSRDVVVGKELTKLHEDVIAGKAGKLLEIFSSLESIRGEFSVLISARV